MSPDDLGPFDRCISRGLPGSMFPRTDTHGIHIVQAPGVIAIRTEMIHEARLIPLDGRPHEFSEYACREGNYGLANILSASRAAEKEGQ